MNTLDCVSSNYNLTSFIGIIVDDNIKLLSLNRDKFDKM